LCSFVVNGFQLFQKYHCRDVAEVYASKFKQYHSIIVKIVIKMQSYERIHVFHTEKE
jgi:hypothetical protein